jgi:hypothetical protein
MRYEADPFHTTFGGRSVAGAPNRTMTEKTNA